MAGEVKESGIAWTLCSVDDMGESLRAIVNDVTSLNFSHTRGVQDTTGIDSAAHERLLLLPDYSVTLNGVFNPTALASHDVFKTVPFSAVIRTTTLTISGQICTNECLYGNYDVTRALDGSLVWTATGALADGTEPAWST